MRVPALFFLLISFSCTINLYSQLRPADTFFPNRDELKKEKISWYYLTVPENWAQEDGKKIELAIAVLHTTMANCNNSVIFLQGGPGGGSINGIYRWLDHPLRKNSDIILIDIRGTGFSKPALCPDLGKSFLNILSKNQAPEEDDKDKIKVSLECQQDLIDKGIDINAYNSDAVCRDLYLLKNVLHINKWNVYGVSYGTFIAQEYARHYPNDVKSLVLDSPIPDISTYYNKNTSNYTSSLSKFFQACKQDSICSRQYPNIENIYYSVIADLTKNPITVEVDKNIIASGKFTYNAEDFKIATQQALYNRKLIEILPAIIYQFHYRNQSVLSSLVSAFSAALSLDYGTYYCFTCKEVIPYNNIDSFETDARKEKIGVGIDFYKSDFVVCKEWSKRINTTPRTTYKRSLDFPVLILSGEFDPITPQKSAEATAQKYKNSTLVYASTFGHGPGFSDAGSTIIRNFVTKGLFKDDTLVKFERKKVAFRHNLILNKGVATLGKALNKPDWLLFFPLILATVNLLAFTCYLIYKLTGKNESYQSKIFPLSFILTSLLAILSLVLPIIAVYKTSSVNYFIIALGLPDNYRYIFLLQKAFLLLSVLIIVFTTIKWKKMIGYEFYTISLFSIIVINTYLYWWGFYL